MVFSIEGLNNWKAPILGTWLDLDYAPKQHLWQCHDVLLSYITSPMFNLSLNDGYAPGTEFTDEVWRNFPTFRPNLAKYFIKTYGNTDIQPGDIVFWSAYGGVGGLPHVAVALTTRSGSQVYCVSQNPGVVREVWLTTDNILGTLRPIGSAQVPPPEKPEEEDDEMKNSGFYYVNEKGTQINIIVCFATGSFFAFGSNNSNYVNGMAAAFGTGNFAKITPTGVKNLKAAMAKTRSNKA